MRQSLVASWLALTLVIVALPGAPAIGRTGVNHRLSGAQPNVASTQGNMLQPCGTLAHNAAAPVDIYTADQYLWYDSNCAMRSTALRISPQKGGEAIQFTYQLPDGSVRQVGESGDAGARGFGYIVSHLSNPGIIPLGPDGNPVDDDSPLGSSLNAQSQTLFAGRHHAIHEFTLNYPRWGIDPATGVATKYDMPVTIHWLFATGRDHPLWAVTFDLSGIPAGAVQADTRAPYGDMNFDGAPARTWGDDVGGVAWGDRYHFRSTTSPFTLNSSWDWSQLNSGAPYNAMWTTNPSNAEMGIAGTQVIDRQDAGGYSFGPNGRGLTSAAMPCPADPAVGFGHIMPCASYWAYQSVNYSFPNAVSATASKRLAWGADWGYLGQQTVNTINGNTVSGWPRVSYSTYIVLGPHSGNPTKTMAQQAEAINATTLTTPVGFVVMSGPAGVRRPDTIVYSPAGYNPVYGSWEAWADNGKATLNFSVGGGNTLKNPLIVLRSYWGSETPSVTLNGVALQADVDYFATYLEGTHDLWLTLNKNLSGNQTLAISNTSQSADFSVTATPTQSISPGDVASFTLTLQSLNGFSSAVNLSALYGGQALPGNLWSTQSETPAPNGSGASTLTIASDFSTPTGTYPLTLRAVGGGLTKEVNVQLVIAPRVDSPLDQQAKQDMTKRSASDGRFGGAIAGAFVKYLNWNPDWELRAMAFNFSGNRTVVIYHITNKADTTKRATIFFDPDAGGWGNWVPAS